MACYADCQNASYNFVNCKLQLICDSEIVELLLTSLTIEDDGDGGLILRDGNITEILTAEDLAALGLDRATIEAEIANCHGWRGSAARSGGIGRRCNRAEKLPPDGTGYSVGDKITHIRWYDVTTNPPSLIAETLINETTGAVLPGQFCFSRQ